MFTKQIVGTVTANGKSCRISNKNSLSITLKTSMKATKIQVLYPTTLISNKISPGRLQ